MLLNVETRTNIKCRDGVEVNYLYEGDKVVCYVGERVYIGTLSWIGGYKENADSEPQQLITIDTFKSRTSMSRDMIKVEDITYISKNPFYDNEKKYSAEQDILDTLIKKGYSQEQAKAIRDRMSDATMFYFMPYTKATTYAIEAVRQINESDKNDAKDIIMKGAKQCMEEVQKEYFELVEIYAKEIEQCDRDTNCLTDTLNIVTKCWNDLRNMKAGDIK